uniref:procollagen-proline 4-dioxygenase n=1 Tax=Rhizophora mucronata TaxID=61149 RepID=A0A2P2M398_RHIMU
MKAKSSKGNWILKPRLGLPAVFLLCSFVFIAGFFASNLLSQNIAGDAKAGQRERRQLHPVKDEKIKYETLPKGETGDDFLSVIPFQVLSWKPRAQYFPKFASAEQCRRIIDMAKANLTPSTLALRMGETEENTKGIRTSSGMFISADEDKTGLLGIIEEKIARVSMLPTAHGEPFNVLRYEIGQKYDSHYDAFNPAEYGPQKDQRVASFLLYLSDVQGGETMFPFENGNIDENYDFQKCGGLKVKPRQGDGLLFYSVFLNTTIDPTSLHGSCPVVRGEKWVATKWIRDRERIND